jgi:hypothetical protein
LNGGNWYAIPTTMAIKRSPDHPSRRAFSGSMAAERRAGI